MLKVKATINRLRERVSLIKYIAVNWRILKNLKALKNSVQERDVLIIGNGPSVDLQTLESLKNVVTIACNRFYLCYNDTSFRPDFTAVIDEQMIKDFGREILENAETPVFCGNAALARSHSNAVFVPLSNLSDFTFGTLGLRPYLHTGDSVIICAIQLAYFMGAKNIYLYGVDHSFMIGPYVDETKTQCTGEGNHFIANYRSEKPWFPPNVTAIEQAFQKCDSFLKAKGIRFINLTPGSKLEQVSKGTVSDYLELTNER